MVQARAVAAYLVSLRPVLAHATETRQVWVKQIGLLMADTRHGNPALVAQRAGDIGRGHGAAFRDAANALDRLKPPGECAACHHEVGAWLAKLVRACDVLTEIGRAGELSRLRDTQSLLAEARAHAHAFNEEYARLCQALRSHVDGVMSERAARVPAPARDSRPVAPRPRPGTHEVTRRVRQSQES